MRFQANGSFADIPKIDLSKLTIALTEEEKKSPYAQYYTRKPADPDPDAMVAIQPGRAIDPAKATIPGDIAELVKNHGKREVENGYCIMPDGTGYATILTRSHEITPEIEKVYESYNPEGDLYLSITWQTSIIPGKQATALKCAASSGTA